MKVVFTYTPESQNGPCFVYPACSLTSIKTQLRTTQRRNRKTSDARETAWRAVIG